MAEMVAVAETAVETVAMADKKPRSKMSSHTCSRSGVLRLIAWGCLPLSAFCQNAFTTAPVPRDPLELTTSQSEVAGTPASRALALDLLARARSNFALRSGRQGYDLKVSFTVDSQGETNHDGSWEMEDLFSPGKGHRWTATTASGYTITSVAAAGKVYGEGTASAVPLRLLEARGALFDPLQSPAYADHGSIRTSPAIFHGAPVTCLLLSRSRNTANPASGRDWEESEECIDTQSGLLQVHSEVPGRYAVYDYADGPQLGGHILPRTVTISEAGRLVSTISVESLQGTTADPAVFVPSDAMRAKGEAVAMTSATKISRIQGQGVTLHPVCVFGMVTPAGRLVEAHTLQPSDPNSRAALEDARKIDFSPMTPAGSPPQQHFVFVIEKFAGAQ